MQSGITSKGSASHAALAAHDIGLRRRELWCGSDKVAHGRQIGIDVLIDDSPDTLLRALDAGILAATLRHPWNEHVCDARNVTSASDWRELARVLELE